MSKFIDMEDQIIERLDMPYGAMRLGLSEALAYLDRYPDQVPGRTITESEYRYAMIEATDTEDFDAEELLRRLGITVTPDPEPTNAERLETLFADLMKCQMTYKQVAVQMDMLGVKAPGGDDE